jgi:plastocyanin
MRPPARLCRTKAIAGLTAGALLVFAVLGAAGPAVAATLVINVQTPDGHALAGAVITVRPLDGTPRKPAAVHAVMDQVDRAFEPDLLIVPVGSTVEFPNSDTVSHQIYSFSPAKRFQLPLYRGKPYPPVHFEQPGVVTLGCNIHDEMLAYLLVTDAAYFGRTNQSGGWSADLPRGRYHVAIWHPRLRDNAADLERELTVGDTDRADLTLRLAKALEPAPITGRPHSWDY